MNAESLKKTLRFLLLTGATSRHAVDGDGIDRWIISWRGHYFQLTSRQVDADHRACLFTAGSEEGKEALKAAIRKYADSILFG